MPLAPARVPLFRFSPAWLLALLSAAPALPAAAQTTPAGIVVSGPGLAQPAHLSPAQLSKLPHLQVTRPDHDGKKRTYSGVSLQAVLAAAGAELGEKLPRKGVAHYLTARAADGYLAVFALAELDPAFAPRTVLLADRCDGQPLAAKDGPYEIIVPEEKKMGRCVRQVQSLRIEAAKP
ncbi:molybdopterin-binding protein [Hymenobacter ruricola]|uniref:Molybdopterin-binding protein n=1 Tax=Hymenobacter ruricola TaxID=2791023 RepID=A0ABS0I8C7_9BACT|nr:molybdopterin-binding protein [Hymenobacter ruricola]MBF9223159.1 molybdopterin-binding protein [Hymenobacter ruricola]